MDVLPGSLHFYVVLKRSCGVNMFSCMLKNKWGRVYQDVPGELKCKVMAQINSRDLDRIAASQDVIPLHDLWGRKY